MSRRNDDRLAGDPKPEMTKTEARSHDQTTLPPEMASAVNLFAHPMAGIAAMGAIGFGLAGHAMGLWLGAVAGAAEAARKMTAEGAAARAAGAVRKAPKLRLVASSDMPDPTTAAVHALVADAEVAMRDTVEAVTHVMDEIVDEALATPAAAPRKPARVRKTAAGTSAKAVPVATRTVAPSRPAVLERPAQPDDLKAISGIGPKLEKVLNGFGIWTYAQVSALDEAEIAWLDGELGFGGRIGRDDWTGQAGALLGAAGQ